MEEDFGRIFQYWYYDHEGTHTCKVIPNLFFLSKFQSLDSR